MSEVLVKPPVTLKTHGIFHDNGRYALNDLKNNIVIAVHDRTGKPMSYPVVEMQPISSPIDSMVRGYVFNWLNKIVSEANHTPGWKEIDDYHGKGPVKRQFGREQTQFVFDLLKKKFELDKEVGERSKGAKYLLDSGLTPEILDFAHEFMFPPPNS